MEQRSEDSFLKEAVKRYSRRRKQLRCVPMDPSERHHGLSTGQTGCYIYDVDGNRLY